MKKKQAVKIELTSEQQEQLKKETGQEVRRVKLDPEQLEARVTPKIVVN